MKILKETFATKIKLGDVGTFEGIAMTSGTPEGRSYFTFTPESVKEQEGKKAMLMLDHSQSESMKTIGTALMLKFDGKNLKFEAKLLMESREVKEEIYPRIKEGILDGVSVGITIEEYEEDEKKDRIIVKKFSISELSVVPFPAFKKARIKKVFNEEEKLELRSGLKALFKEVGIECENECIDFKDFKMLDIRNFETILKAIGFSNSVATKISCLVKPILKGEVQSEFGTQEVNSEFNGLRKEDKLEEVCNFLKTININEVP